MKKSPGHIIKLKKSSSIHMHTHICTYSHTVSPLHTNKFCSESTFLGPISS